jgi:ribose 5-phosphate isomerase A
LKLKQQAAERAVEFVKSGMVVGLGHGSTAMFAVRRIAQLLHEGQLQDILGVPCSLQIEAEARRLGIPLTTLDEHPIVDLTIDGADEVDPDLNLIKGLGRAMLREKIVEIHADHFVVVADESKLVPRLGRGPLPVDIVPFGLETHIRWLNTLGCRAELRLEEDGSPVVTDNGNFMALCWFPEGIPDVYALARALADRPGIAEHGLFLDMADEVIVAGAEGIRVIRREG